ncbi:Aminotransferase-like, plant mobile domain [Sesbania bispinosa]|nr:Aminotransferase-like, plant mobile domain [Sesbania bispinosa]
MRYLAIEMNLLKWVRETAMAHATGGTGNCTCGEEGMPCIYPYCRNTVWKMSAPRPKESAPCVMFTRAVLGIPLLRSYESHVAHRLWSGEGACKSSDPRRKLKRPENDYVRDIVDDSGLGPLVEETHSLVDRSLLSTFAERWHRDTRSFHLPVGEMTITLDDVNNYCKYWYMVGSSCHQVK